MSDTTEKTETTPEAESAPPVITFEELRRGGVKGVIDQVLAASDLNLAESEVLKQSIAGNAFLRHLSCRIDQFLDGVPFEADEIAANAATAVRQATVLLRSCQAIEATVRATPSRLGMVRDRTPQGQTHKRMFN